jgi:ribose transport system substrate-binding protein
VTWYAASVRPENQGDVLGYSGGGCYVEHRPGIRHIANHASTVVLGALVALREAGKARPDQFLGGIDGEPEAVEEIKKGGPYKTSVSLASPVFGYAMAQHAADWLEGKSIPQAMDILPKLLTSENMASYET